MDNLSSQLESYCSSEGIQFSIVYNGIHRKRYLLGGNIEVNTFRNGYFIKYIRVEPGFYWSKLWFDTQEEMGLHIVDHLKSRS